jgi:transposase
VDARPREVLADKDDDAGELRSKLPIRGVRPFIPWKADRREPDVLDRARHVLRNRIERMFGRPKNGRRIATRYDRLASNFLSDLASSPSSASGSE